MSTQAQYSFLIDVNVLQNSIIILSPSSSSVTEIDLQEPTGFDKKVAILTLSWSAKLDGAERKGTPSTLMNSFQNLPS